MNAPTGNSRRLRRLTLPAVMIAVIAALFGIPTAANASNGITTTGDVNLRSGPGTTYDILDVVPLGTSPDYICWTEGEDVNGVNVWFRVNYGTEGWISSYWDDSSYSQNVDITTKYGIPACGGETTSEPEPAPAPTGWQPNCTPSSDYLTGAITVAETSQGKRISLTPTDEARRAWDNGQGWDSTVEMWHAIQDCVPGLYDKTADSVWQQLECHQRYALITKPDGSYATGPTYDLEAWVDPLLWPNDVTYALSRCLGGVDPLSSVKLFAMVDGGNLA